MFESENWVGVGGVPNKPCPYFLCLVAVVAEDESHSGGAGRSGLKFRRGALWG